MSTKRFTVGEAATQIGIPVNTLRTWLHQGWVDSIRTHQSLAIKKGRWDRLTPREIVSIRLAKEFGRFMAIKDAAAAAAACEAAIIEYFFTENTQAKREKYRFVGIQMIESEGKVLFAPHYAESLSQFQNSGCFGYFVIDLAMIPMPGVEAE